MIRNAKAQPRHLVVVYALAALSSSGIAAQGRVDMSGTWVYVAPDETTTASGHSASFQMPPDGLCAARCTIRQTADALTISHGPSSSVTLRWNGRVNVSSSPHPVSGRATSAETRVAWVKGVLVIMSGDRGGDVKLAARTELQRQGDRLLITRTIQVSGQTNTRVLTYRRP